MQSFILYAEQRTWGQSDALSAGQIQAAFSSALQFQNNSCGGALRPNGAFVGGPRITRQAVLAGPFSDSRYTRVAWLYESPSDDSRVSACIANLLTLSLSVLGPGWTPARAIPYDPTSNGLRTWWASGEAARTRTHDAFDLNQQIGGTSTVENPVGPQLAPPVRDLSIPNPLSALAQALPSGSNALKYVAAGAIVVGGTVGLWYAWPWIAGTRRKPAQKVVAPHG